MLYFIRTYSEGYEGSNEYAASCAPSSINEGASTKPRHEACRLRIDLLSGNFPDIGVSLTFRKPNISSDISQSIQTSNITPNQYFRFTKRFVS